MKITTALTATALPGHTPNALHRLLIDTSTIDGVFAVLSPLVKISAELAAERAANRRRGRPLNIWEVLDSRGYSEGFVTTPDEAGFPELRQNERLVIQLLGWAVAEEQMQREVGFGDDATVILTLLELPSWFPGEEAKAQNDELNAAGNVPAGLEKAPSPLQIRPYGEPDGPCRMAWFVAGATLVKNGVEWHPELDDPSDWVGEY